MGNVGKFNNNQLWNTIISWGARTLFILAFLVLCVLSFVDEFNLSPEIRDITFMALVSAALNYLVWDSFYTQQYEKQLNADLINKDYCIHKRYYNARKGWKYAELQEKIREYNEDFTNSWLKDCEDITGRTIDEIAKGNYKYPHKMIIWRIKHRRYPTTGIKTPNDVLYILSVGKADSMKIKIKAEEHYHTANRIKKLVMLALSSIFVASLTYGFIQDGFKEAIITLVLNVVILFMALFFGSTSGIKGGKLKLSTAEIVSEKLEEWKNIKPEQEPYPEVLPTLELQNNYEQDSSNTTVELV